MNRKLKHSLGIVKTVMERTQSYIALASFAMVLYLYVRDRPLGKDPEFWIIMLSIIIPIIAIVDWIVIYPAMLDINFGKKNKEFQEMKDDIKEIKKILEDK